MGTNCGTMVTTRNSYLTALGFASVLLAVPNDAFACGSSELNGRVKSVTATEAQVDPLTHRIGDARLVLRTIVTEDGAIVETTHQPSGPSTQPSRRFTAYFENGRLARQVETVDGKMMSTRVCSYDAQGRVVEVTTQSENGERSKSERYEYGDGLIRRRITGAGGASVITQTLDGDGRVIKEVEINETMSKVVHTTDFTYAENREERCGISFLDSRPLCKVIIRDSHGNEIEVRTVDQTIKTTFEYDSAGNWISRRTTVSGRLRTSVETIVQRKIEYW